MKAFILCYNAHEVHVLDNGNPIEIQMFYFTNSFQNVLVESKIPIFAKV